MRVKHVISHSGFQDFSYVLLRYQVRRILLWMNMMPSSYWRSWIYSAMEQKTLRYQRYIKFNFKIILCIIHFTFCPEWISITIMYILFSRYLLLWHPTSIPSRHRQLQLLAVPAQAWPPVRLLQCLGMCWLALCPLWAQSVPGAWARPPQSSKPLLSQASRYWPLN